MDTNIEYILIATVAYFLGLFSGLVIRTKFLKDQKFEDNSFVLFVVTLMWAFSILFDIFSPTYETSPFIHGLMGAIVGFFYKPLGGTKDGNNK